MSALSAAFIAVHDEVKGLIARDYTEQRKLADTKGLVPITISTLIFIDEDVCRLDVLNRWTKAVGDFHASKDENAFALSYAQINEDLVREAKKLR
jgi:hypothetical protein